jgi:hypothetical protein
MEHIQTRPHTWAFQSAYSTCLSVDSIQLLNASSLSNQMNWLLTLSRYRKCKTFPPNRACTLSISSPCDTRGCTRKAIKSSVTRSKILIFTNAVCELAAEMGGLLRFDVALEWEREREEAATDEVLECCEDGDSGLLFGQRLGYSFGRISSDWDRPEGL